MSRLKRRRRIGRSSLRCADDVPDAARVIPTQNVAIATAQQFPSIAHANTNRKRTELLLFPKSVGCSPHVGGFWRQRGAMGFGIVRGLWWFVSGYGPASYEGFGGGQTPGWVRPQPGQGPDQKDGLIVQLASVAFHRVENRGLQPIERVRSAHAGGP